MMRSRLVLTMLLLGLIGLSLPTVAQPPVLTIKEFDPQDQTFAPPSVGENAVLLPPGQAVSISCPAAPEGSGILCAPQFAIDVPAGSTGLRFQVQANSEFVVFLRLNQEVAIDGGRAVSDFGFNSRDGQANFFVPAFQPGSEFPGLQEGRYFFAVAHFETADQRFTVSGAAAALQPLTLETPTSLSCTVFELMCVQQFSVDVDQAGRLVLEVRGSGNFQVHARFGQPVELPPLTFDDSGLAQIGAPISDAFAAPQNGVATLSLDAGSSPPLQRGRYYVALFNLENFDQNFTLSASVGGQPSRQHPLADFGFEPVSPSVGQTVRFNDRSSDPEGEIRSWLWDFGDGQSSTAQNPTHSYSAPGTYRVSLLVTNDANATASATQTLTVRAAEPGSGLQAVAFAQLSFSDPAAWERSVDGGCVAYTNTSQTVAELELITLDGATRIFEVDAGKTVLVCGNAVHFD